MKKLLSIAVILGFTHFLLFGSNIGNKRNEIPNMERSTNLSLKMSQCVNTTSSITETACNSYTAPDGVVYTTSGVKTAIIPNAGGCDSIITINLTIDQSPVITGSISTTTVMGCTPPVAETSVASLEGMGLVISDDYTLNANLMVTSNDVSSGSCPTTITRTYTIKDGCNHQSTTIHTIYLADNIAPSITGTISTSNAIGCSIADKPIAANSVAALESMGLAISDNCTADANIIVSISDVSSGTCPITVTRVYTITDGCGNASTIVQTITVDDTISPTITYFPTTQTFCSSPTGIYSIPQMTATDNCVAPLSYTYSISGATSRSGVGKDASGTFNVGASTITWTVTDGCGNISTATTNVIINGTVTSTTNTSICLTELPYFWNGLVCGAAGPYTATLVSSKGCDSLTTLNLTVNSTVTSTTNLAICPAELPYFWNGLVCGAAGSYIATLVSSKGCDSLATLNLTVNPTMTSTTNIAICSGLLPYTWNGLTFPAAGSQTSTLVSSKGCDSLATLNLTVNSTVTSTTNRTICATELPIIWNGLACEAAGSYIATLVSSKGCDSLATLNLTVTPAINPVFTILDSICIGATPPILPTTSNNGITGVWSPSVVSNTTTGSYSFTPTAGQCANNTPIIVVVRVNQVPSVASMNVHSNSPICAGTTLNLYANGGVDYEWSGPTPYAVTFQNPTRANATVAMSGNYYVTITTVAGCSSTATLNVTVNPLPNASASNNGPICSGGTLNLTSGGGTGYSWSGPNGYTSIDQNPTISTVTAANSGIYRVTVTGTGGCTSTAQTVVVINALPTPTANNNGHICSGVTLNLISSGGTGYSWSGPSSYTSAIQNPSITSATTANSGVYTVTVTNAAGCTSTAQTTVVVNPTVTSTTNIAICSSELPYTWNGLIFPAAGSQTATLVSYKGCDSLATLNLTVTPPITPLFTILDSICTGATPPILPTTSINGITGTWSPSVVSNTATGSYTFTPTAGQCANNTPITVVVKVNHVPTVAEMNVSSNSPICVGTTLNLIASGGLDYEWSGPAGYATTFQNPTRANATVGMSGNYVVTVTTAAGCSSTAIIPVVVNPLPNATASNNGPICSGGTLNLTSGGGFGYLWSGPSGYDNLTQNPSITSVTTANAGVYRVTVTGTGGCTSSSQTIVVINPSVSTTTDIAICPSALPYIWNGLTFTTAGSQTVTLSSISGCDSLATLNLTVNPTSISNNPVSICMGESYVFNGHTYTTTGNYIDTLQTIHGCDSIVTTHLAVLDPASVHGTVVYSGGYIGSGDAMVILYQTGPSGHHQLVDSVMIGANGTFSLLNIPSGDYYLYVKLLNHSAYQHVHNSYFDSTYQWQEAAILNVDCATDTNITVHMVETGPANPGNGHITGTIQQYTNNKTIGDPLPGVEIYVRTESNNEPIANCTSKSNGVYEFTEIPIGSYSIYVDIPGIPMIQTYTGINVTASDTLFENLNFYVDTTTLSAGIYTDEILSVSKIETPELSVNIFPNPVKNELSIEVSNQTEGLSIEVLDINGKSLYKSTTGNRAKIEMNAFATGVYLIKIQSKNTVIFKKIIKE